MTPPMVTCKVANCILTENFSLPDAGGGIVPKEGIGEFIKAPRLFSSASSLLESRTTWQLLIQNLLMSSVFVLQLHPSGVNFFAFK